MNNTRVDCAKPMAVNSGMVYQIGSRTWVALEGGVAAVSWAKTDRMNSLLHLKAKVLIRPDSREGYPSHPHTRQWTNLSLFWQCGSATGPKCSRISLNGFF
jgi:hypothetical protein